MVSEDSLRCYDIEQTKDIYQHIRINERQIDIQRMISLLILTLVHSSDMPSECIARYVKSHYGTYIAPDNAMDIPLRAAPEQYYCQAQIMPLVRNAREKLLENGWDNRQRLALLRSGNRNDNGKRHNTHSPKLNWQIKGNQPS